MNGRVDRRTKSQDRRYGQVRSRCLPLRNEPASSAPPPRPTGACFSARSGAQPARCWRGGAGPCCRPGPARRGGGAAPRPGSARGGRAVAAAAAAPAGRAVGSGAEPSRAEPSGGRGPDVAGAGTWRWGRCDGGGRRGRGGWSGARCGGSAQGARRSGAARRGRRLDLAGPRAGAALPGARWGPPCLPPARPGSRCPVRRSWSGPGDKGTARASSSPPVRSGLSRGGCRGRLAQGEPGAPGLLSWRAPEGSE